MNNYELASSLNDYGCQCKAKRQYLAAKAAFLQASKVDPSLPLIWSNLGTVLHEINELDAAEEAFKKALSLDPNHIATLASYALLHSVRADYDKAHECYEKTIEAEPDHTQHKWNRALTYLEAGDWVNGFKWYEARFDHAPIDYPKYKHPRWQGENLNGKTIVVYEEQGFGDKILFSRFIWQLKDRYPGIKKIYCLLSHSLQALFWEMQKDGLCEFLPIGVIFPDDIDYGVFMMSLPLHLGCTDPNHVPPDPGYIKDRCEFQKRILQLNTLVPGGKKVGLCWHGSIKHAQDHIRSIPFEKFIPLMDDPYWSWFSLQADDFADDVKKWGMQELINDSAPAMVKDGFPRTGVQILNLDLVISVDTAIAHLAGALDVPVWTLVTKNSSWLWQRDKKTTPWYPSMTIFRQETQGDWDQVINTVKDTLEFCKKEIKEPKR